MNKENGGPAFPSPEIFDERRGEYLQHGSEGMSLRDYFASNLADEDEDFTDTVKQRMLGRPCPSLADDAVGVLEFEAEFRAKWRYMRADAMLAERSK